MFEKEAEEYANGKAKEHYSSLIEENTGSPKDFAKLCWQDGAKFGFTKANEWHYPSKGELPECDEKTQLVFYVNCYYNISGSSVKIKQMVLGYYQKSFMNDDVKLFVEKSKGYSDEHFPKDVIAWKEIELPKEIE